MSKVVWNGKIVVAKPTKAAIENHTNNRCNALPDDPPTNQHEMMC